MLCSECGENEARVHITKVINGIKEEKHICESCASKLGEITFSFSPMDMNSFLSGLFTKSDALKEEKDIRSCPECGMTLSEFKKTGRFGCDKCYEIFMENIMPMIKQIHGVTNHTGKAPKYAASKVKDKIEGKVKIEEKPAAAPKIEDIADLNILKQKLKLAVQKEEYEEAAKLRDRIKALQE